MFNHSVDANPAQIEADDHKFNIRRASQALTYFVQTFPSLSHEDTFQQEQDRAARIEQIAAARDARTKDCCTKNCSTIRSRSTFQLPKSWVTWPCLGAIVFFVFTTDQEVQSCSRRGNRVPRIYCFFMVRD